MVWHDLGLNPGLPDAQNSLGFWDTNGLPNLDQTTRPSDSQQKKRTCRIVVFVVPADLKVKLKESEKRDKYLDLARELKTLWNVKATVIPVVIGTLGSVTKGLDWRTWKLRTTGNHQTTALLRSARILRRVLDTWGNLLSLKLQWNTIS